MLDLTKIVKCGSLEVFSKSDIIGGVDTPLEGPMGGGSGVRVLRSITRHKTMQVRTFLMRRMR